MKETLSRTELAKHFNVCYLTILNWKKQGLIKPFSVINKRERYRLQDMEKNSRFKLEDNGSNL
jgi:hypothetical protein